MSGRKVFTAGEVLQAADVNDYLMDQSVMVFAGTAARGSAIPSPTEGMVTYRSDDDVVEVYNGSSFVPVGPGQILQVVEASDSTNRTTTSTSFVDAGTLSVTITPTSATSTILLLANLFVAPPDNSYIRLQITDGSDVVVGGASNMAVGANSSTTQRHNALLMTTDSPASTSAETYKVRFYSNSGASTTIENTSFRSRLIAMEVAG